MNRREFLGTCARGSLGLLSLGGLRLPFADTARAATTMPGKGFVRTKLSPFFVPLEGKRIRCTLCPRGCVVAEGKRGYCEVRENRGGRYYSLVYGNPCAIHVDPIEKKPLFHVLPGTKSFSIATAGCNFDCKFCQNFEISQALPEDTCNYDLAPEAVVSLAGEYGCRSVAYTYVEPTIFFEYMYDTAKLARKAGVFNVCHSNGFINPDPLNRLLQYLDAANIDLKGFTEVYYREMTGGSLAPVLETLKTLKKRIHLEITNLIEPTKNDDPKEIKEMCAWIRDHLGKDTPLHFSRFYPTYKLRNLPPTPASTLEKARDIAVRTGLEYVYIGNVPGHEAENTYCAGCGKMLVRRAGYMVQEVHITKGACRFCGKSIPGIW